MSDPFKDFLEELERRRGNATPESSASEPESDAPASRTRARRPGGSAPSGQRPTFKLGFRTLFLPTLLVVVLVAGPIIALLTDARWFESLGAGALYWQRLQLQGGLFVAGTLAAAITHGLTIAEGKGGWISPIYPISSGMGQAFIVASFSWIANFFTTIAVSLVTKPKPDEELRGLVYSLTEKVYGTEKRWYLKPAPLGIILLVITIVLNIIFF